MIIWMMESLKQSWYTNSSCSKHMAGDASKFIHISPKNSEYLIYGDNKQRPLDQQAQQVISNDTNKSLVFDWLFFMLVFYLRLDCPWWLWLNLFDCIWWLSLIIVFYCVLMIAVGWNVWWLIVFDCVWLMCYYDWLYLIDIQCLLVWLILMIMIEGYVDYWLLLIKKFIYILIICTKYVLCISVSAK